MYFSYDGTTQETASNEIRFNHIEVYNQLCDIGGGRIRRVLKRSCGLDLKELLYGIRFGILF